MIGFSIWYSHMRTAFPRCLLAGCFSFRFFPAADPLKSVALIDSFSEEWLDLCHVESNQHSQLTQRGLPVPLYQIDLESTPPPPKYYVSLTTKTELNASSDISITSFIATHPLQNSSGRFGLQAFTWIANRPKEVWKSRSNHTGDNTVAILPPPTILHDQATSTNSTDLAALTYTANWTASTNSTDLTANTWANRLTCVKQHNRLFCFNRQNRFHQLN